MYSCTVHTSRATGAVDQTCIIQRRQRMKWNTYSDGNQQIITQLPAPAPPPRPLRVCVCVCVCVCVFSVRTDLY